MECGWAGGGTAFEERDASASVISCRREFRTCFNFYSSGDRTRGDEILQGLIFPGVSGRRSSDKNRGLSTEFVTLAGFGIG